MTARSVLELSKSAFLGVIFALLIAAVPHAFAHTAAYNQGFNNGKLDATGNGVKDSGDDCALYGYAPNGPNCNDYFKGYDDGFAATCAHTKWGCNNQG